MSSMIVGTSASPALANGTHTSASARAGSGAQKAATGADRGARIEKIVAGDVRAARPIAPNAQRAPSPPNEAATRAMPAIARVMRR